MQARGRAGYAEFAEPGSSRHCAAGSGARFAAFHLHHASSRCSVSLSSLLRVQGVELLHPFEADRFVTKIASKRQACPAGFQADASQQARLPGSLGCEATRMHLQMWLLRCALLDVRSKDRNTGVIQARRSVHLSYSYSLNSLKGGYIRDCIGDHYRGY